MKKACMRAFREYAHDLAIEKIISGRQMRCLGTHTRRRCLVTHQYQKPLRSTYHHRAQYYQQTWFLQPLGHIVRKYSSLPDTAASASQSLETNNALPVSASRPDQQIVAHCFTLEDENFDMQGSALALKLSFGAEPEIFFEGTVHRYILQTGQSSGCSPCDLFLFRDGSVVLWDAPKERETDILELLRNYRTPNEGDIVQPERESLHWRYDSDVSGCSYNRSTGWLILPDDFPTLQDSAIRKAALSHGVQTSVKLNLIEARMDRVFGDLRAVPGSISGALAPRAVRTAPQDRRRMLQSLGQIVCLRELINLRGLFDVPDAYWSRPALEESFRVVLRAFEVPRRISVMNQKLDYAYELCEARREQLAEANMTRLVYWIIILILLIVALEPAKYLRYRRTNAARRKTPPAAPA